MAPSTLIVPVESQVREMDAKLLLSCAAVERGLPVIIGSRAFIHFKVASLPRGVYLAKSMRRLSIRMFDLLRQLGHDIVAWDEEGLVRLPDPEYYRHRLCSTTFQQVAELFAWGPENARAFRSFPGYRGSPVHVTGNPRVDLMREELRPYFRSRSMPSGDVSVISFSSIRTLAASIIFSPILANSARSWKHQPTATTS